VQVQVQVQVQAQVTPRQREAHKNTSQQTSDIVLLKPSRWAFVVLGSFVEKLIENTSSVPDK